MRKRKEGLLIGAQFHFINEIKNVFMKKGKWTLKEQANFIKRIGELLSRGYPLSEAIKSLTFQMPVQRKGEITECLSELREGYPFYKILNEMNFHSTLIGFVYFAEQHGDLAKAFQDGSEVMLKRSNDIKKLKQIFMYPLFLIFITLFLFVFIEKILLPRFSVMFQSMNIKENFFTKIVYVSGDLFPFIIFITVFILFSLLLYYFLKFQHYRKIKQIQIITSLPIIGPYFRLLYTHYFSIQFSYLLTGGLSINEALTVFENKEQPFENEIGREIKDRLTAGISFEEILNQLSFFEEELSNIVRHGQENGKLEQELLFFSKYCLQVFEDKVDRLLKLVQPTLFTIIGILIISMYLAILLPMFHLLDGF